MAVGQCSCLIVADSRSGKRLGGAGTSADPYRVERPPIVCVKHPNGEVLGNDPCVKLPRSIQSISKDGATSFVDENNDLFWDEPITQVDFGNTKDFALHYDPSILPPNTSTIGVRQHIENDIRVYPYRRSDSGFQVHSYQTYDRQQDADFRVLPGFLNFYDETVESNPNLTIPRTVNAPPLDVRPLSGGGSAKNEPTSKVMIWLTLEIDDFDTTAPAPPFGPIQMKFQTYLKIARTLTEPVNDEDRLGGPFQWWGIRKPSPDTTSQSYSFVTVRNISSFRSGTILYYYPVLKILDNPVSYPDTGSGSKILKLRRYTIKTLSMG